MTEERPAGPVCAYCGQPLTGRPQTRYCSPSHRVMACRRRKGVNAHAVNAAAVAPGCCSRVSRCQGRLWQTVSGYRFCEACELAPVPELFAQ